MKSSKAKASHLTAATAQHYPANAHTHVDLRLPLPTKSRGRRRIDPLAGVWDDEVVPMLRVAPGLRPIVVFRKISHRHPEIGPGIRRTLERRIRLWQGLNDPSPEVTFLRGPSPDQWFLTPRLVSDFLRSAHQGILKLSDLPVQAKTHASIFNIIKSCKSGTLAQRNKALLALAVVCHLPLCHLAKYPIASTASLYRWKTIFVTSGFDGLTQNLFMEFMRHKRRARGPLTPELKRQFDQHAEVTPQVTFRDFGGGVVQPIVPRLTQLTSHVRSVVAQFERLH